MAESWLGRIMGGHREREGGAAAAGGEEHLTTDDKEFTDRREVAWGAREARSKARVPRAAHLKIVAGGELASGFDRFPFPLSFSISCSELALAALRKALKKLPQSGSMWKR